MKYFLIMFITWLIILATMGFLYYIKHYDFVCFLTTCIMSMIIIFIQTEMGD